MKYLFITLLLVSANIYACNTINPKHDDLRDLIAIKSHNPPINDDMSDEEEIVVVYENKTY